MKRWLCCFLLITVQLIAKSDTVFVSSIGEQIKFSALKGVKVAQTPISEQPVLINDTCFKPFQPDYKTKSKQAYWLKITLTNNAPYNKTLYINSSMCDYAFLYQKVNNDLVQIAKAGRLVPHKDLAVKYSYLFLPLNLKKSETNTYYIYVYNKHIDAPYLDFYLYDNKDLLFETYRDKFDESAITLYFLGAFTFLSLFILFLYYKSRHRIYLFYALYLIGAILYSLTRLSPISILGNWFANFPLWRISFNEPAQFIFFAAYNLFVIELLDIKKQDLSLAKILKNLAYAYLIYALFFYVFTNFYLDQSLRNILFKVHRIILFPLNILLAVKIIYKVKSPVSGYFITGISLFMITSLLAVFSVLFVRNYETGEPIKAINIFQIGLMLEALCFAFALGYKIKLTEDEKNNHHEALILQLENNRLLTEKANLELEEKIKERTTELMAANKKIEEKKAKEIKAFFDQKLAQAETMALRSQMNPHFLFNSLNSIKYLIQSNQNKLAITYLSKFSKLVRMVLEHSRNELVSLAAEIEALKLYLEIESNRLGEQFTYQINIGKEVNADEIQIPPMLLQPFVENAIWHGLLNSEKATKQVTISVNQHTHTTTCSIIDNGIGREKAALLKQQNTKHYQSVGTSIIFDRVKLFNQQYLSKIEVQITDLINHHEVDGTKVLIYINTPKL